MGRVGLELGYIRLDLPSHVLRAAPEREHVVAVREARHGRRAGFGRGSSRAREAASSPVGLPAAAAATGLGDSTANGLPVERRSEGCRWGVGRGALFSLALCAVVRCRCFER